MIPNIMSVKSKNTVLNVGFIGGDNGVVRAEYLRIMCNSSITYNNI